jgi:hypothetical protein
MIGFNGTDLDIQPAEHGWVEQDMLGVDGDGRAIYPALREYRMVFSLLSQNDFVDLLGYFRQSITGTVVATLPEWGAPVYQYHNYSGAVVRQPAYQTYFEEHSLDVNVSVFVRTDGNC